MRKKYTNIYSLERFGRSLIDTIRKQYDELRAKISELEVEKWTKLVDAESKYTVITIMASNYGVPIMADLTYHSKAQRASREDLTTDIRLLRDIMNGLNKPIMQMSDQMSMLQDKFDSKFFFTLVLYSRMLNCGRRRANQNFPLDVHNRI